MDGIHDASYTNWKSALPGSHANQSGRLTRNPRNATPVANRAISSFRSFGKNSSASAPASGRYATTLRI